MPSRRMKLSGIEFDLLTETVNNVLSASLRAGKQREVATNDALACGHEVLEALRERYEFPDDDDEC